MKSSAAMALLGCLSCKGGAIALPLKQALVFVLAGWLSHFVSLGLLACGELSTARGAFQSFSETLQHKPGTAPGLGTAVCPVMLSELSEAGENGFNPSWLPRQAPSSQQLQSRHPVWVEPEPVP